MRYFCVLFALLSGVARAEEPLTLDAAIALAEESNSALQAARVDLAGAEAAFRAARAPAGNPQISLGAGARFTEAGASADAQVGVTVPIDVGGSGRRVRNREAAELDRARARLASVETAVAVHLRLAFSGAVAAQRRLALAEDGLALAQQIERAARRRHELGETSVLEPTSAALGRTEAEARLLVARAELAAAMQRLRAVVGLPAEEPLVLSPPPVPTWPEDLPRDGEALIALALQSRADLTAARAAEHAAELDVLATLAAGLPPLWLGARWEREGDEAQIFGGSISFALPVQRDQVSVARAEQAAGRAAVDAEALDLQVEREVLAALAAWEAAVERQRLLSGEALTLAEESRRLVLRAYEAGEEELLAVLAMQRQAIAAWASAIEADAALQAAYARLEAAIGQAAFNRS